MEILDAANNIDLVCKKELIDLWVQGFDEERKEAEDFFDICFSKDRFCDIQEGGHVISVLYWLDYMLDGKKLAYIYAVTTKEDYRNKGYCKKLFQKAHKKLKSNGYAGAMLVPSSKELFVMYEKLGYKETIYKFVDITTSQKDLKQINVEEFAALRKELLPKASPLPADYAYKYIDTFAYFYKSEDGIFALSKDPSHKLIEHLSKNNPPLLAENSHGMFLPLKEDCPVPRYIGIDLA